jgi:cobalt-zinc-cadmium efflux system protein
MGDLQFKTVKKPQAHSPGHSHAHGHSHSHGIGGGHGHFAGLLHSGSGGQEGAGGGDGGRIGRSLRAALSVTLVFLGVEAVAGWWANSLALLSDAAHMLTDVGALGLSLFTHWVARQPSSPRASFGFHRAEILGALVSGLSIWLLAGVLLWEAAERLASPPEVKGPVVFAVACVGLAANVVSLFFLNPVRGESINARAAYLHLLFDCLGSLGAVLAGTLLWWKGWRLADPLVTIALSILMLWSSWGLVREAVEELMERTPSHLDPEQVRRTLRELEGVQEVHDLHIWSVGSGRTALSAHLLLSEGAERSGGRVLREAQQQLEERFAIRHTTLQVEEPGEFQPERCYDCDRGTTPG